MPLIDPQPSPMLSWRENLSAHLAGVVIRSSLLTEVPVTDELSISSYETRVTYFRSPDDEHRERTLVTFGASLEPTFYQHTPRRIRDITFRSVAASKSRAELERSKLRGAQRACEELSHHIRQSIHTIGWQPDRPPSDPAIIP